MKTKRNVWYSSTQYRLASIITSRPVTVQQMVGCRQTVEAFLHI